MSRAGSPEHKPPSKWWRLDSTQELVGIYGIGGLQEPTKHTFIGGTTGTWVIPNLAVAYAKYLSPRFHAWASQAAIELKLWSAHRRCRSLQAICDRPYGATRAGQPLPRRLVIGSFGGLARSATADASIFRVEPSRTPCPPALPLQQK